jgi:uncharacterized membrane protein YcgQ (UPF0703/DUF1980 family)
MDYIYGPISQKYCFYFYILSIIGFILLLVVLLATIYQGFTKKHPITFYLNMIMLAILYGMFYLQNRLLYNMCTGSMKKEGMEKMGMSKDMSADFKKEAGMQKDKSAGIGMGIDKQNMQNKTSMYTPESSMEKRTQKKSMPGPSLF